MINNEELLNIYDLEKMCKSNGKTVHGFGIVFCFGTSLISHIIQAKTRLDNDEIVPSHVLLMWGNAVLESTTDIQRIRHKTIPSGVRMWRLKDWIECEKTKLTKYFFYPYRDIDNDLMTDLLHLPYGRDTIIDFLLKDKSEGDRTHGLICSQYVNKVTKLSKQRCPSPADLYRIVLKRIKEEEEKE